MKAGKPVILVDDEDRENEGDLVIAADMATPENINFMARDGRGLICLPMESEMVERLNLPLMGRGDNSQHRTAFTVSIEAKEGVTTGISAADRAQTIKVAIDPKTTPSGIATPGHVFPLQAREGGVLVRAGHTEAAVDLAKMAGFSGAGVICEIMNDDGSMSRLPDLVAFAQKHGLKVGTIADLIGYRRQNECLIERIHEEKFTSKTGGKFDLAVYKNTIEYAEHIALVMGDIKNSKRSVFVRMHAENAVKDILQGDETLHRAMKKIEEIGEGVIVILRPSNPMAVSDYLSGVKRDPSDDGLKTYGIGAQILRDLGVSHMTLLTDSPRPVIGLDGYDLFIDGTAPLASEEGKS
jgi:3,4-dihydroxy 2-butanone 4-phosphate synthase/GTP cyclohydrolase II